MKKSTKVLSLSALVGVACLGLVACGGGNEKKFKGNAAELGMTSDMMEKLVLGDYDAKYQKAAAIVDGAKMGERYESFAEAEYDLIYESAIIIPWRQDNGYAPSVSKSVPWRAGRASYGLMNDRYKNVIGTNAAITKEQRAKVTADYEAAKGTAPAPAVDADGYTYLTNGYQNGSINSGKYTVGAGTENEVTFDTVTEYNITYAKEIGESCLNYLVNTWTYNSYHYCNMVDGLVENDKYGGIVGAVAESYKNWTNPDGTETWSFKLKSGVEWVNNNDGSKYGDVTADDFVTAAKYVLDARHASGTAAIVYNLVKGAKEYYDATNAWKEGDPEPSFADVGVKNVNGKVEYTLKNITPYFLSNLTYSPFLPVNATFLANKGSSFGKTENDILVNGAYRITTHDDQSKIVYTKNDRYWDAAHVYLNKINRLYIPGTFTPDTTRLWYETGKIDAFTPNSADDNGYTTYVKGQDGSGTVKTPAHPSCCGVLSTGDATYIGYWNFNRLNWEVNDSANAKNYDQKLATAKAILNNNFRKGFLYGVNVIEYLKRYQSDSPYNWLARAYTNRELCTHPNGKDYVDLVTDIYNKKNNLTGADKVNLTGIEQGGDPIYSITKATAYLNLAKAELIDANILEEKDFPIRIDVVANQDVEGQAYDFKQYEALQEACGDIVKIQFNVPNSDTQDTQWGSVLGNYDLSFWSGWGPDYADPNTYAHTLCIDGDMVEYLGF